MNERKQQLNEELDQLKQREESGVSLAERAVIEERRRAINDELATIEQAEQQQEREQHTQEVNETNSDIVVSIFNALFPETKAAETKIGLTEFGELRTDFYQLVDGVLADRTQLMDDKKAYELAQKDEKIRLLSKQGQEIQAQLDEAHKALLVNGDTISELSNKVNELKQSNEDYDHLNDQLHRRIDEKEEELAQANKEVARLTQENADLQTKLEAAQKPREESKPSQSFTDRMNEIKSKNEARIKTAAELAAEGQLGFRGKVEVPSVSPFRHENIQPPATYVRNDQVLAAGDAPVGSQFPEPPNVPTPEAGHNVVAGPSDVQGESGQETATKGWVEERIAERFDALKKEILGEQVA